jgi:chemotaxis protein methyltransferase CheR
MPGRGEIRPLTAGEFEHFRRLAYEEFGLDLRTGKEPLVVARLGKKELGEAALDKTRILATDISTRVLASAQRGAYPAERFEGLADRQLHRHLLRGERRFKGWYRVKPTLREAVEFRRLNLMERFADLGPFSAIFCRNAMIYFDRPTQQDLANRLAGCLEPGGYLIVGHAESLNGIDHPLRYVHPAVYRNPEAGDTSTERVRTKP